MGKFWWVLSLTLLVPALFGISGDNSKPMFGHVVVADQGLVPKQKLQYLSVPADAVAVAMQDAIEVQQKDPFALPFTRWVWVQSGDPNDFKAISDTLNKVSRSSFPYKPVVKGIVARIDLRRYTLREQDLKEWISFWENFQYDPWFSLLITKDTLNLLDEGFKLNTSVRVKKTKWIQKDNKWISDGFEVGDVKLSDLKDVNVIRLNAEHLKQSGIEKLQAGCETLAPIVDSRYFIGRVLSTIKDLDGNKENLFSTVWGGLYYEFVGIRSVTTNGIKTDLDQLLFDIGVGSKEENFVKLFDRLESDEAAVIFRSDITGKRRRIRWFPHLKNRLSQSVPAVFITEDVRDRDVDIGADPILNLLDSRIAAYELIFTKANGQQGYALYNGEGKLLEEAASDVANDHKISPPHTNRLQSGISCIRCHGQHDGWIPFKNDLKVLLREQFDVYGDTSKNQLKKPIFETVNSLFSKYNGDPTVLMMRLRDDYSKAVITVTGSWKDDPGQINTVKFSSAQISKVWAQDRYDQVDAKSAMKYLGLPESSDDKVLEIFGKAIPPVKINIGGIIPEDPRIHALKVGLKINPYDFSFVYNFMMTRVSPSRDKLLKEIK